MIFHIFRKTRKYQYYRILVLFAILILTACGENNIYPKNISWAPTLEVSLATENHPQQHIRALRGGVYWNWDGGSIIICQYSVNESDFDDATIIRLYSIGEEYEIVVNFVYITYNVPPCDGFLVRRWRADIFDGLYRSETSEIIEADDNIICVTDDGYDYVYHIDARWINGSSGYYFRVVSASE